MKLAMLTCCVLATALTGCGSGVVRIVVDEPTAPSDRRSAQEPRSLAQATPSKRPGTAADATLGPPAALDPKTPAISTRLAVPLRASDAPFAAPAMSDWTVRDVAIDSLGRIGAPAVPALTEALASPQPRVRREAARALAKIGPEARSAVPALVLAADDEDDGVRWLAVRALGQIGPDAKDAIPAFMKKATQTLP